MNNETRRTIFSTATVCGWVLAVFLLGVSVQMLFLYESRLPNIPSEEGKYHAARQETLKKSEDAAVREAFQAEDQQMRELFFAQRTRFAWGGVLLITGLVVMAGCFALASVVKPPAPEVPEGGAPPQDEDSVKAVRVTYALTAVGIITLAAVLVTCVPRPEMVVNEKAVWREETEAGIPPEAETPEAVSPEVVPVPDTPENPPGEEENPFAAGEDEIEAPPAAVEENPFAVADGGENDAEIEAPPTPAPVAEKSPEAVVLPAKSVIMPDGKQWSRFRGPAGDGVSAFLNVPEEWDDETGKNVAWKVPVPLDGFNSPVVWEKHIFLTGATAETREIYCFDAGSGTLLWTHTAEATEAGAKAADDPDYAVDYTGYAPSTGATDGTRFFAIFTNGDLVAVDFSGKEVWKRGLGVPKSAYGHASSLAIFENLLLVQYDQGGRSANLSKIMAINTETGETVWETARPGLPNSWPTPTVMTLTAEHDGEEITQTQVLAGADPFLMAYDVRTGRELWKVKCLQADVGPSPIFTPLADGGVQVITANEFPQATGITPVVVLENAEPVDITKTHVAWKNDLGLPDTVSPLAVAGKYLFLYDKSATVTLLSLTDGEMLWDDYQWMGDLMLEPKASPGTVGEKVYLVTDAQENRGATFSRCYVLSVTDTGMEILHANTLGESCVTSPAFADGRVYLRGVKHLYALGENSAENGE